MLSLEERKIALTLARDSISYYLVNLQLLPILAKSWNQESSLEQELGCFVTLHKNGNLRGCIGSIEGYEALYLNIVKNAVNAGFSDPRFPSLREEELHELTLEISVMGKLEQVHKLEDIEVGIHGLIAEQGGRRGLLLPQVPIEQGWDRKEFIQYTCHKAGLSFDAYLDSKTRFYSFTAEVFGEE